MLLDPVPWLEHLTHTRFQNSLEPSRLPRFLQNGLLLPAKEHQHTHLQPGHIPCRARLEGPSEFGFFGQVGGLGGQCLMCAGVGSPQEGSRQNRYPEARGVGRHFLSLGFLWLVCWSHFSDQLPGQRGGLSWFCMARQAYGRCRRSVFRLPAWPCPSAKEPHLVTRGVQRPPPPNREQTGSWVSLLLF